MTLPSIHEESQGKLRKAIKEAFFNVFMEEYLESDYDTIGEFISDIMQNSCKWSPYDMQYMSDDEFVESCIACTRRKKDANAMNEALE